MVKFGNLVSYENYQIYGFVTKLGNGSVKVCDLGLLFLFSLT